jgi:hypothetical protein
LHAALTLCGPVSASAGTVKFAVAVPLSTSTVGDTGESLSHWSAIDSK